MTRKAVFFSAERQSSAGKARQAPSCSQQLCTFNCVSARRFLPSIESRSCPILLTTPDTLQGHSFHIRRTYGNRLHSGFHQSADFPVLLTAPWTCSRKAKLRYGRRKWATPDPANVRKILSVGVRKGVNQVFTFCGKDTPVLSQSGTIAGAGYAWHHLTFGERFGWTDGIWAAESSVRRMGAGYQHFQQVINSPV